MNNTEIVSAIWESLKYYIHDRSDRLDAAASLIETLHDLGFDPETIENISEDDALLRKSLKDYLQMTDEDDIELEEDYLDDIDDE